MGYSILLVYFLLSKANLLQLRLGNCTNIAQSAIVVVAAVDVAAKLQLHLLHRPMAP